MSTVGIIAEYNPFHKGHAYQISKAKELTGADSVVIIMSGNFVQRGTPAILDKYTRARHAVNNGASLVLELPVCYSTASAELFAHSAVTLLDKLGCIDYISFGCETDNLQALQEISNILAEEPEEYKLHLKNFLSLGDTYPVARNKALSVVIDENKTIDANEATKLLETPNNILAIEYLKALTRLNSTIKPVPVKRIDKGYHSIETDSVFASATAIRACISNNNYEAMTKHIPSNTTGTYRLRKSFINIDDFSDVLASKLIYEKDFDIYYDISEFLANRINNTKTQFKNITSYTELLLTKNETHTHINRAIAHILLEIKSDDIALFKEEGSILYGRPLAMNLSDSSLLKSIKNNSSIELIKRFGDFYKKQTGVSKKMLDLNLKADSLYNYILHKKTGIKVSDDFTVKNNEIFN